MRLLSRMKCYLGGSRWLPISIRYWLCGRGVIRREIDRARSEAVRESRRCFVTGERAEEYHHGFDVSTYPIFAASAWNLWPMTERAHAAYHKWMGGTAVSTTPISLYWWAYFIYTRRGWFWLLAAVLAGLYFITR